MCGGAAAARLTERRHGGVPGDRTVFGGCGAAAIVGAWRGAHVGGDADEDITVLLFSCDSSPARQGSHVIGVRL
jgi:hypothetical protein